MDKIVQDVLACATKHFALENISADVSFVDADEIKTLNSVHRGKDNETDVLSFPLVDYKNATEIEIASITNPDTKTIMLGDIIICAEVAKLQAEEYGHSLERETAFLILHGFLHLLGYAHDEMESVYEEILTKAGYVR